MLPSHLQRDWSGGNRFRSESDLHIYDNPESVCGFLLFLHCRVCPDQAHIQRFRPLPQRLLYSSASFCLSDGSELQIHENPPLKPGTRMKFHIESESGLPHRYYHCTRSAVYNITSPHQTCRLLRCILQSAYPDSGSQDAPGNHKVQVYNHRGLFPAHLPLPSRPLQYYGCNPISDILYFPDQVPHRFYHRYNLPRPYVKNQVQADFCFEQAFCLVSQKPNPDARGTDHCLHLSSPVPPRFRISSLLH